MSRLKFPKNMPQEIRDLINMDFSRENCNPSPGGLLVPMRPPEPAAAAPSPPAFSTTELGTSNPHSASKEPGAIDRESNGRFANNNCGSPGNQFARQVATFRACLINCVTQDDFKAVVYRLVERAQNGNLQAIKLLFSYLLGTPKPVVEPDELDLHEMHLAQQTALAEKTLQEAALANPPANDAPLQSDGEVGRPAEGGHEAPPPPPACAPSTNRTNGEPCSPTTGQVPSTNRASDVCESGKLSQQPSTNRPNGEPAASGSKHRPSVNGPNRARAPSPISGGSPDSQDTDEKRT